MTVPVLAVEHLGYCYPGGIMALHEVNLQIHRGRRLAILGANGSGKTTLLFHLNGTFRPSRGKVLLDGQPVGYTQRQLQEWRRRVGLVLQEPDDQLFAATVEQDVSFGPLNLGLPATEVRERVTEALSVLRIAQLAQRATHALSFGQKKRVAIAGIVAMRPEVIVLDEPTAGLDAHSVIHLLGVLRQLHDAGTTVVFSTHDVELAYSWADEVAIFHEGTVRVQGETLPILGDRELLRQVRLHPPWIVEVAEALGMRDMPLPRSREALLEQLTRKS